MGTRAQIQVIEGKGGVYGGPAFTLYHHWDGYPSHILEDFQKAMEMISGVTHSPWMVGRAGKVVSFLCAAHPGEMEPEAGHALHGDIRYYYRLWVSQDREGKPLWEVQVYETVLDFFITADDSSLVPVGNRFRLPSDPVELEQIIRDLEPQSEDEDE